MCRGIHFHQEPSDHGLPKELDDSVMPRMVQATSCSQLLGYVGKTVLSTSPHTRNDLLIYRPLLSLGVLGVHAGILHRFQGSVQTLPSSHPTLFVFSSAGLSLDHGDGIGTGLREHDASAARSAMLCSTKALLNHGCSVRHN